jgi:hypothetical protein
MRLVMRLDLEDLTNLGGIEAGALPAKVHGIVSILDRMFCAS